MRTRSIPLAAALAALAGSAASQPAKPPASSVPPPPVAMAPPAPPSPPRITHYDRWEDLPAAFRERAEPQLGVRRTQSVIVVQDAVTPDTQPRVVDAGDVLARQSITPGPAVRLLARPNGQARYGEVGALAWPVHSPSGDYYCWRQAGANQVGLFTRPYYCYADRNNDGAFEIMIETGVRDHIWGSEFQMSGLGSNETLRAPVPYERTTLIPPIHEYVLLRYLGPRRAYVRDGILVNGIVEFQIMTGGVQDQGNLFLYAVNLNDQGRGELTSSTGYALSVIRVDAEGRATVQLRRALPTGEGEVVPPMTRESLLETINDRLAAQNGY